VLATFRSQLTGMRTRTTVDSGLPQVDPGLAASYLIRAANCAPSSNAAADGDDTIGIRGARDTVEGAMTPPQVELPTGPDESLARTKRLRDEVVALAVAEAIAVTPGAESLAPLRVESAISAVLAERQQEASS
jgi:hypothetical protein